MTPEGLPLPAHPVSGLRVMSRPSAPPPVPSVAELRGVHLGGGAAMALHGIDLEVAGGEALVLLGAGGAAVLDVLAGFIAPTAGEVRLDGRSATGVKPHRRRVGLVLREDGPFPHLGVAGTIRFALAARAGQGGEEAVGAIMQAFGLAGIGDRPVRDLSPEQRVRAALARALAGRPRLVLLDDPFAALDAPARDAVLRDLLPALAASGAASVLATRDPFLALVFGGRTAALVDGAVRQAGPAQALYDAPADAAVARLLGEANLLPARAETVEDGIAVLRLDGGLRVEADAAGAAVPGRPCLLFVRPARIAVSAGTAAEMGEGALPAVVTSLAWRGDHVRLELALGAPGSPPATLVVTRPEGAPLAGLAPGQNAAIAWQPWHARVLPPDAATT